MKQIIILLILLVSINSAFATHEQVNETLYTYNETTLSYKILHQDILSGVYNTNIEKIVCEDGICSDMHISIAGRSDYDIEYDLHYAPNETVYYSKVLRVTQDTVDTNLFNLYRKIHRTLYVDGVEVANYNVSLIINMGSTAIISFKTLDQTLHFGTFEIGNTTLFFNELVCVDQYNYLANNTDSYVTINMRVNGGEGYDKQDLGGLTGIFMNKLKDMPFGVGKGLYNVLFPFMYIVQLTINFSFTVINLIIYDWYYALLLLETICMMKGLQGNGFAQVIELYIQSHVKIIVFVHHRIVLPLIKMIIRIIEMINPF